MPAANLKALSPAPRQTPARTPAANAHSVHAVGDSAGAGGSIGSEEDNKRAIGGGPHVLLPGLCSCSSLCAKQQQSVRNMAGGARKETRREKGTALCMSAVTQTTRQGLTAIMPIGAAWW